MIDLQRQQALFIKIARTLKKPLTLYAIGGTAMMLRGIKANTLDIDLVFLDNKERDLFKNVIDSLEYKPLDAHILYGTRSDMPLVAQVEDARIDLFTKNILGVCFSESMTKRADQVHQFTDTLFIRPADIHDIIIMKSATSRAKDEEDIIALLKSGAVKWEVLLEEANNQVKLGNETAIMNLGAKLEKLANQKLITIPKGISDKLWKLFTKQVREKAKKVK